MIDEGLEIAKGQINKLSHVNKFGYNTTVGGTYEPISDLGTNILPASADVVTIVSASADDVDTTGTGAHSVEIQGLDANYVLQTETVSLNGTTAVTTTANFLRVFRMKVLTAGTGATNTGALTASIGGSNIAEIQAGAGQTLMGIYTVPAGHTAYLTKFQASLSKNQEAVVQLRTKAANNGAWQVKGQFGTFSNIVEYEYTVPLVIIQKTDIEFRAKAGATSEMGIVFDMLLERH